MSAGFRRAVVTAAPASSALISSTCSWPYDVGCGRETSVRGLLDAIASCTGAEAEPEARPGFSEDVRRSCLDASRARRDLGWTPQTTLEAGIAATVASFQAARPA